MVSNPPVELDDRTQIARADRQRDAITRAAGYQTLRFSSKRKPSVPELANLFTKMAAVSQANAR